MGETALRAYQVGVEAVKGTAVAATRVWYGKGSIQNASPEPSMPEEERASYDAAFHAEQPIEDFQWDFEGPLDTDDIIEMFRAAITKVTAGTLLVAGEYSWPFVPTNVSATAPDSLSLEQDAAGDIYKSAYARADTLEIAGASSGGPVTVKLSGPCKDRTPGQVLTVLASRANKSYEGWEYRVALDASGVAPFTTFKDGEVLSFNYKISQQLERFRGAANSRLFSRLIRKRRQVEANIVMELATTANAEIVNRRNATQRVLGLRIGDNKIIATTNKYRVDLISSGVWVADPLGESGGVSTVSFRHKSMYEATNAFAFKAVVQNARAA
jgi:hypothetical protein